MEKELFLEGIVKIFKMKGRMKSKFLGSLQPIEVKQEAPTVGA